MRFSLLFFSSNEAELGSDKYRFVLESARFADRRGFEALWVPERHFHAFGGVFPNPAILCAALATATDRIRIRAGSVVVPLHHPVRIAEDWSMVDNLSGGRVDLALAVGWNPRDFALAPERYPARRELTFEGIRTLRRLWRGEGVAAVDGQGERCDLRLFPAPRQRDLALWLTCTGGSERFVEAGEHGLNVLTALLVQSVEELDGKLAAYRRARARAGHDPAAGRVTVMLHTFVGEDLASVRRTVEAPFKRYLASSIDLWQRASAGLAALDERRRDKLLDLAFERYFHTAALLGTPETCGAMVERLRAIGVDEIACLVDFGVPPDIVLANLSSLDTLRAQAEGGGRRAEAPVPR